MVASPSRSSAARFRFFSVMLLAFAPSTPLMPMISAAPKLSAAPPALLK